MRQGHLHLTPIPDGTRVRHYGHQFPRAYRDGTATILSHFWNGPWLEYIVQLDKPDATGTTTREWSADTTIPVTPPSQP